MMRNVGSRRRGHEQWGAVATAAELQDDQRASCHQLVLPIDFEESLPLRAACRLRVQKGLNLYLWCVCTVKLSHLPVALPFIFVNSI